jgi:hypothetical protein
MREFWYVKARNITTGEEIQRLAGLADEMFESSAATAEMKTYLIGAGRAKPDFSDWEIVEVQRADRWAGADTNGPTKRVERPS